MAIANYSRGLEPIARFSGIKQRQGLHLGTRTFRWTAWLLLAGTALLSVAAQPTNESQLQTMFGARARKSFIETRARYVAETNNVEAAWQFARACFDLAEYASDSTERAETSSEGINVCRQILVRNPQSAPLHYYLGMNLGQLARTKGLSALKLVSEMEREFLTVRTLDEQFDFAGADRNLGLLYKDAPSIASIGNRSKAKQYLRHAVELSPDYPENRLNLIEAYLDWGDRNGALREFKALDKLWAEVPKRFSGPDWAAGLIDWGKRYQRVKKKLEEGNRAIESPREAE